METLLKSAKENGWCVNPDQKVVNRVRAGIARNVTKYGHRYCPCVVIGVVAEERRKDYICPCTNAKTQIEDTGKCKCNLFWDCSSMENKK